MTNHQHRTDKLTVNIPSELFFQMKRKIDFLQEQSDADRVQIETLLRVLKQAKSFLEMDTATYAESVGATTALINGFLGGDAE